MGGLGGGVICCFWCMKCVCWGLVFRMLVCFLLFLCYDLCCIVFFVDLFS